VARRQRTATKPAHSKPALPPDWRGWLLSATARASVATGFLLVPTARAQLGDATLAILCFVLAAGLIAAMATHWYVARERARRDLAADALAVLAVTPTTMVAAGIQSADDRFGGRTSYALAALAATVLVFAIGALVAGMDERLTVGDVSLGALGGALVVAALIGNPSRFNADDAWQALSIAWMAAALATAAYAVLPGGLRSFAGPLVYALFAVVIYRLPADKPAQSIEPSSLPLLAIVATGALMVLVAAGRSRTAGT
jgi:hypothetical protein